MNRLRLALALVALTSGCAEPVREPRAATATLSKEDARARAARVSNVVYALELDLDSEAPEYVGSVQITFDLSDAAPLEDLTLDFVGGALDRVRVNGGKLDTGSRALDDLYNGYFLTLPAATLRTGANAVEIAFSHPYSRDGSGLYRFKDPFDGQDYLYTNFEPYHHNELFPSFDQPDLKARFSTQVSVPADWEVISIVAESSIADEGGRKRWTFPPSAPISTYVYALHAGDYRRWESDADEIPLRLFARKSVAGDVHPEHWFVPTRQGFAFFERYFDVPYPFGKYDQIIVPHFNAGAMENVGAVTFSERFLRRGTVTRQAKRSLASVILHEMAHMWFGDLVTMDWWNGLWLNESFATFMANLAMIEATAFTDAQLAAFRRTVGAYRADERDTTHPIEMPIHDTDAAFANFDAITYGKGAATLAQLRHLVGPDAFRRGVSSYLKSHAYANTAIEDFLSAIATAAERDLAAWSTDWLRTPGANRVAVEFACEGDRIARMAVVQDAPPDWPTLRTHRTQLGLYDLAQGEIAVTAIPVTYAGARTPVAAAEGMPCPDFVYANHGDWDYAEVALDAGALDMLRRRIHDFPDPLVRSMLWQGVYDMLLEGRLAPAAFIDFALAGADGEDVDEVLRQILGALQSAWSYQRRLDPDQSRIDAIGARIEETLWDAFERSEAGSDRQVLLFDRYLAAAVSATARERLVSLLASPQLPAGFVFDQDRRWSVVAKLSGFDQPQATALASAERERDPSDKGRRSALSVAAARPDAAQQRRFMAQLLAPGAVDVNLSAADARAIAGGLFPIHQQGLQLEIVDEVLAHLQTLSDTVDATYFGAVTGGLLGTICDAGYLEKLDRAIDTSASWHPSLRKRLLDMRFDVNRCLAIGRALVAGEAAEVGA